MGDANSILTAAEARHLLRRTGFGAKPRDVDRILSRGDTRGEMADRLLNFQPTRFRPGGRNNSESRDKWLKYMLRTPRQLQEKLVLFWHDHFSTDVPNNTFMRDQNRLLRSFCHGNFKDFVKAINVNAAMMDFLNTSENSKAEPNENYARELMELFTLGVFDASGQTNYAQADIVQIARAFTGWRHDGDGVPFLNASQHDYSDGSGEFASRGPKVIFKTRGQFGPGGRSFTVNGSGAQEIDEVINIIFDHRDSDGEKTVARYVGRRLFEFFAHPNPDLSTLTAIIHQSNFGVTWDVASFLRELFVHDAFYESAGAPDVAPVKSVKWPVDYCVGALRQLGVKPTGKELATRPVGASPALQTVLEDMGQVLFEPPSVFGWDTELGWISSFPMLSRYGFARDIAYSSDGTSHSLRPQKLLDLNLTDPVQIVNAVAAALGVPDQITPGAHTALVNYLTENGAFPVVNLNSTFGDGKLRGLFVLIMQSPAYQLH